MRKLIVANWKMNPATYREAEQLAFSVIRSAEKSKNVEVILCPPFVWLTDISHKSAGKIKFGAQDVFWEKAGAYTGEISPKMLTSSKVNYVIIGHSERRALGETDEIINKKVKAALTAGLEVILCVGEPWPVRRRGFAAAQKFVRSQLINDLKGVKKNAGLIVAYEPVWAIGTGRADKPEDTVEMVKFIKGTIDCKVLYGGSVTSRNAAEFLGRKEIDGALVGGASLKPAEFKNIVRSF